MAEKRPDSPEERSISRRITRGLSLVGKVLTSDISQIRAVIGDTLSQSLEAEQVSGTSRTRGPIVPEGVLDGRLMYEAEVSQTPFTTAELLAIPKDSQSEPRALSEAYDEILRRMAEVVFIPHTHPLFAFLRDVFHRIRIRQDVIMEEKPFDRIFDDQITWYYEHVLLADDRDITPALAYHWRCYAGSSGRECYEDNLYRHSIPEVKLYGVLMRSFFRSLNRFFQRLHPEIDGALQTEQSLILDQHEEPGVESSPFREAMMQRALLDRGRLLRPDGLSDYFSEDLDPDMRGQLDRLLPRGFDGVYLFDTNLMVSAQVERFGNLQQQPALRRVLNFLALEQELGESFQISEFLVLPEDPRTLAVKNLVFWKAIVDPNDPTNRSDEVDFETAVVDAVDLKYLALRLAEVLRGHSNIYEVVHALFPDIEHQVIRSRSFFSQRFKKVAALARDTAMDDPAAREMLKGFFGVLSAENWKVWSTQVPKFGATPFRHLQKMAQKVGEDQQYQEDYLTRWNFLEAEASDAWNPGSPRLLGRVSRLSGWRKNQRTVRSKLLRMAFERMHYDLTQYAVVIPGEEWWQTLHQMNTSAERVLTLPFLMPDGKVRVCQFPYLQR